MLHLHRVKLKLKGGEEVEYKDVLSIELPYGDETYDTLEVQAKDARQFLVRSNGGVLLAMGEASNVLVLVAHKQYREVQ